jgi:hypothetical protein
MTSVVDIWGQMEVLFKHPRLEDPKRAKFVFIAESHSRLDMRRIHGAFISSIISPKTLLLVESVKAGIVLEGDRKKMTLLEYSVGESDAERLALMGWDYYGENLEESREKYFEKKQALSALVKGSESSTIDRDFRRCKNKSFI